MALSLGPGSNPTRQSCAVVICGASDSSPLTNRPSSLACLRRITDGQQEMPHHRHPVTAQMNPWISLEVEGVLLSYATRAPTVLDCDASPRPNQTPKSPPMPLAAGARARVGFVHRAADPALLSAISAWISRTVSPG